MIFLIFRKKFIFNLAAASAAGRMGSSNTSLEPARRAEENAFYRTSLALSKPEISGFQFCIRYTLKAGQLIRPWRCHCVFTITTLCSLNITSRNLAWFWLECRLRRSCSARPWHCCCYSRTPSASTADRPRSNLTAVTAAVSECESDLLRQTDRGPLFTIMISVTLCQFSRSYSQMKMVKPRDRPWRLHI